MIDALTPDSVYLIPRELTDEEWGEVAYNVNRKTSQGMTTIPVWVLREVVSYAHFIAGHRVALKPADTLTIDDVIALVKDCGEDAQPDSEYRLACNDIIEELNERRKK